MNDLQSSLRTLQEDARRMARKAVAFLSRPDVRATIRSNVMIFAVMYFGCAAIAQPFYVPSGSMQPTLGIGDMLIVSKYDYGYSRYSLPYAFGSSPEMRILGRTPEPGDVIVFRLPSDTSQTLVKRVVGLPGDRIQMRDGRLVINGRQLPLRVAGVGEAEDGPGEAAPGTYFKVAKYIETLPNGREHPVFKKYWGAPYDNSPEYVVPPGHLFVMGDNRDDSADSRIASEDGGVGYLPVANVMGRARVVLASVDFVNADGIWEWPLELRVSRTLDRVR